MNLLKSKTMLPSKTVKTASLLVIGLFFVACSNDDDKIPEIINQEEVITTMELTLVPEQGGEPIIFTYQDLDGAGPNKPIIKAGTLTANTKYEGTILLLNETVDPAENITIEVKEEGTDHQFFFNNTAGLTINYTDVDTNKNPIGIEFTLKTSAPISGSLTVTLRHEPSKTAEGVMNGNIENAGGESDIIVTFPVAIK